MLMLALPCFGGVEFDGVDDYINMDADSLDWGAGDGTVSLWVRYSETQDSYYTKLLIKGAGGANQKRYTIQTAGDYETLAFSIDDNGAGGFAEVAHDIASNDGYWHHVVGVRDGNNLRLYIDGAESPNSPVSIAGYGDIDDDEELTIGAGNTGEGGSGNDDYFDGSISDVKIWNRALSAAEVRQMYQPVAASIYGHTVTNNAAMITHGDYPPPLVGGTNTLSFADLLTIQGYATGEAIPNATTNYSTVGNIEMIYYGGAKQGDKR